MGPFLFDENSPFSGWRRPRLLQPPPPIWPLFMGLSGITLGQHRADHQLNLVEKHDRQDDCANALAGENRARHGHAAGEALFEPQKVMVISSALSKPSARLPNIVTQRTSARSTMLMTMTTPISRRKTSARCLR